jgi:hypothetical protein
MRSSVFLPILACLFTTVFLSSCGGKTISEQREYSMEGVKIIHKGEDDPYQRHALRDVYELDAETRLLLRLESFTLWTDVVVHEGDQVWVQIALTADSMTGKGVDTLRLCPLTKDWMMLATWYKAHPFSATGSWEKEGGDFDEPSCMKRANEAVDELNEPVQVVRFDATRWYKDYPRGRGQNLGFVLLSEDKVKIRGEKSASYSPRLLFKVQETFINEDRPLLPKSP